MPVQAEFKEALSASAVAAFDLEPEVQVGAMAQSSGYPHRAGMHTDCATKPPGSMIIGSRVLQPLTNRAGSAWLRVYLSAGIDVPD